MQAEESKRFKGLKKKIRADRLILGYESDHRSGKKNVRIVDIHELSSVHASKISRDHHGRLDVGQKTKKCGKKY